jgi:predicted Rossmann fold flavoprotein
MSGGTRCNLTHATDSQGIVAAYGPPGRFLHSALAALSPQDLVALVEREGVATKIESTGKIFPASDKATDILAAFLTRLRRTPCQLVLGEALVAIVQQGEGFCLTTSLRSLTAGQVIVTTGGQSYPGCGTTGDGFRWAVELGHRLVPPRPALVPVTTNDAWVRDLQGVTIPDVALRVIEPPAPTANGNPPLTRASKPKCLDVRRGSFLFAHFGMSGPVVLDCSRAVSGHPRPHSLSLECDFLPEVSEAAIDNTLHAAAGSAGKKQLIAILPETLPRRLCEALLSQAELTPESKAAELSRVGRARLAQAIKRTRIAISGTRGFAKAEVTAGGVSLAEVDSRTLQSKLVPNLYWAGEVLDLDGPIGGYNFQAAFSTGWLAGESV